MFHKDELGPSFFLVVYGAPGASSLAEKIDRLVALVLR